MALTVVTNVASINAQRHLAKAQAMQTTSIGRLASGLRINRAGDDAAGLAISENLKSQIRSLAQAQRNANDGISLLQTAEGAMNELSGVATRMRELAIQSSTDTVGAAERVFIHQEFTALIAEVDRIAEVTEFNGIDLLDGSATSIEFQVGIHNLANDRISVAIDDMHASILGTGGGGAALNTAAVDTKANAQAALDIIDAVIADISAGRADIGAAENRLQVTVANVGTARENLSAANSRIRETDVADETASLTRSTILLQASASVLAQANQAPQIALSLLG